MSADFGRGDTQIRLEFEKLNQRISENEIQMSSALSVTSDSVSDGLYVSVAGSDGHMLMSSTHLEDISEMMTFSTLFLRIRNQLKKSKSYIFFHPFIEGTKDDFDTTHDLNESDKVLETQRKLGINQVRFILKARGDGAQRLNAESEMDLPQTADALKVNSELQLEVMGLLFSGIDTDAVEETENLMEKTLLNVMDGLEEDEEYGLTSVSDVALTSDDDHAPRLSLQTKSQFDIFIDELRTRFSVVMKYWAVINFLIWTSFTSVCMVEHTSMRGYVLLIWVGAVFGQLGVYYHGKAVVSPYSRQVSPYLMFYLVCSSADLAMRLFFEMDLNIDSLEPPMLNREFLVFHITSLFIVSFVFYGEVFEFEPVFAVWNFVMQWLDLGLTYAIPCLAMVFEQELVDEFVRYLMYACIVGQTLSWVLPLVAFRLAHNRERICWHIVLTNCFFDIPLIGSCLFAIAKHQLHTSIGMLFVVKVFVFLRQFSYNVVYTHVLDSFASPRSISGFFRSQTEV